MTCQRPHHQPSLPLFGAMGSVVFLLLFLQSVSASGSLENLPVLTTNLRGKFSSGAVTKSSAGGRRLQQVPIKDDVPPPAPNLYNISQSDMEQMSVARLVEFTSALDWSNRRRINRVITTSSGKRYMADIIVAKDGSGDTNTIQDAIDNAPPGTLTRRTIIYVKAGTYHESVVVYSSKKYLTLIGVRGQTTVDDNTSTGDIGGPQGTALSATFKIYANFFTAIDFTFSNSFGFPDGRSGAQAVAALVWADRVSFWSCTFLGHQDTLFAYSGRQYYKNCLIVGDIDFIFGDATAIFDSCVLKFINNKKNRYGAVAAQYRQSNNYVSGFVFLGGQLIGDLGSPNDKAYLGRLWGPYCTIVYIRVYMQDVVDQDGWNNMGNPKYEKTASCFTYKCSGPGLQDQKNWVPFWKELNSNSVKPYISLRFINGGVWTKPPSFWTA